jgi:2,3-diketo-5-methylthio-1-phosphopentane phosphatase
MLTQAGRSRSLAVFCDFDGTFSIQDVGSTLARLHIPERREQLWGRYESGELTAWEYTHALLDGFALPEEELDAFLRSVELDPGSRALVAWCSEHEVPFRILSDGFDRNLEALQIIHDIRFAYSANRLVYERGVWRIAAGHPSPSCGCGTGTCKGTIISGWRAEHPESLCVHIGNGRVSDLCGARAADVTFARISEKDTLAPALEELGEHFVPAPRATALAALRGSETIPWKTCRPTDPAPKLTRLACVWRSSVPAWRGCERPPPSRPLATRSACWRREVP